MVVKVALKSISPPRNQQNKRWWRIQDMPAIRAQGVHSAGGASRPTPRGRSGPAKSLKINGLFGGPQCEPWSIRAKAWNCDF